MKNENPAILVTLKDLKKFKNLQQLSIFGATDKNGFSAASKGLSNQEFIELISTAKIVEKEDPKIHNWNYAPLYDGTFVYDNELYSFSIYLGGLGRLNLPNNEFGFFKHGQ